MPQYTSDDITTINALEHIRQRPWMNVRKPREPLPNILSFFAESFIYLGVSDFSIHDKDNYVLIKTSTDWFDKSEITLESAFNGLHVYDNCRRANRGEVFLTAFYYPFYTTGKTGNYGDENLSCSQPRELQKRDGRLLLILKEQALPDNHGIVYEQPPQSLAELENQKALQDIAITHSKQNDK